jgi:hypothetical protein
MPELCQEIESLAPEIIRGHVLDGPHAAHVESCAACARVVQGAAALGRELASVEAPEPTEDLVARTLARVRLADALAATPKPAGEIVPQRPRRRTTAELLETWALPGPAPRVAAPEGRAFLRLTIQAAAALVIVAASVFFTLEFYPAYVSALEERNVHGCQEHLEAIEHAIVRYVKDHPDADAEPLQGLALRDALVKGGYAREEDFLCPSVRGARPGALCYLLRLPPRGSPVVVSDRLGNHGGSALNVVREGAKPELLEGDRLWAWLAEGRK